ncbi:peptidyl-prolyl cis-trans isomerase B-like [Ciona intestinalis]
MKLFGTLIFAFLLFCCVESGDVTADVKSDDVTIEVEKKEAKVELSVDMLKNDTDEKLPDTITINGKEIPIERADRTITSKVTLEITFGQEAIGNITFGLFGRTCPKTVRNFVTLANPNRPTGEGYKGSKLHRIVRGFAFQGGDFLNNDGSGGWSIYGRYFRDENFAIKHFPFCLSMANSGPNTNASQFFVPVIRTSWLDGKHVVFGQIISGHRTAKKINEVKCNSYDRPYRQVWISNTWTEVYKKNQIKSEL